MTSYKIMHNCARACLWVQSNTLLDQRTMSGAGGREGGERDVLTFHTVFHCLNILIVRSWIQIVPRSMPGVSVPIWWKVSFFRREKATPLSPECVF